MVMMIDDDDEGLKEERSLERGCLLEGGYSIQSLRYLVTVVHCSSAFLMTLAGAEIHLPLLFDYYKELVPDVCIFYQCSRLFIV